MSFNAGTRVLSGTPTAASASATYTYTASDADSNTASTDKDTLTFAIGVDGAPAFASNASIADLSLTQDAAMTAVTLPAATGGNGALSYSISPALPAGLSFVASTRVLSGTPTTAAASATYTYTVSDADSNTADSDEDTLTFAIAVDADTAPAFAGDASIADQNLTQDSAMTAVTLPAATGGNGALSYSISPALPAGLSFVASTRVLSGTPTAASASTDYTYTVSDADGNTATDDQDTLTFAIAVDGAPAFASNASIADQNLTQDAAMTAVTLPAASGGNGALSYSISPALPAGLSFVASTRVLSGTPTVASASATYTYTVSDADDNTASTDKDTLTFAIAVDGAPAFASNASIADLSLTQDAAMTAVTLPAATGGNGALSYSISPALPAGLSFVAGTRVLSGTPTAAAASATYTYAVSDADSNTASTDQDTLTFAIAVDGPPVFASNASIADLSLIQNSAMSSVTLPAATGGNGTLSYSISPALPTGLSFNAATRVLSGTPTSIQAATEYTYTVSDADANTAAADKDTLDFDIAVAVPPVSDTAPAFANSASIADLSLVQNSAMSSVTLPAASGGNGSLTYTISPALPAGLSFDAATRVLSGAPTGIQAATEYTYTVSDADANTAAGDKDTLDFDIAVAAPPVSDTAPAFAAGASISDLSLVQNSAMSSVTLPAATGGNGSLTYTISPALPAGLSFDAATRVLSGTPTGTQAAAEYTYTVSDADADQDTLTFTIAVAAAAVDPPDNASGLTLSTGALTVAEGASATFTVVLDAAPSGPVSVALSSDNAGVTLSTASLNFTTSNWDTAQTVSVTGAEDDDAADATATVTLNPSGGGYDSVASVTVTVAITDDDTPALRLSATTLTVSEGGSGQFTVALATQPTGVASITLASSDAGVTLSASTLMFNTANWNVVRRVTVTAAEDDDSSDAEVAVTLDPSGADYAQVPTASLTVTVADNDADTVPRFTGTPDDLLYSPGVAIEPFVLPEAEGGNGTLTYELSGTLPAGLSFDAATRTISGFRRRPRIQSATSGRRRTRMAIRPCSRSSSRSGCRFRV